MIDIAAVGEIVIDFSPIPNAENGNLRYEAQPGGAPSNLLAEASLLGASTRLLGAVGNDPLGEFLCKIAERYGFGGDGLKKHCLHRLLWCPLMLWVIDPFTLYRQKRLCKRSKLKCWTRIFFSRLA